MWPRRGGAMLKETDEGDGKVKRDRITHIVVSWRVSKREKAARM
jgi:hypothetical protein